MYGATEALNAQQACRGGFDGSCNSLVVKEAFIASENDLIEDPEKGDFNTLRDLPSHAGFLFGKAGSSREQRVGNQLSVEVSSCRIYVYHANCFSCYGVESCEKGAGRCILPRLTDVSTA